MKDRIRQVRKANKMTQEVFGTEIGVKGNTITNYEKGLRTPSDAVILSICRRFSINKDWLLTGEGEMHSKLTKNEEISAFLNEVMELPDDDIEKRFIGVLSKLSSDDWKTLSSIADKISKGD